MEFWNKKTIYRKLILITLVIHLLGCFILPFAKINTAASYVNDILGYLGVTNLPQRLTLVRLIGFMNDMGSSDAYFYAAIIVINIIVLAVHLCAKKKGSYAAGFALWIIVCGLESVIPDVVYEFRKFAYKSSWMGNLIFVCSAVIMLLSMIGYLKEMKAQASGRTGFAIKADPEKIAELKNKAGNIVSTASALAKHTAKAAAREIPKVTGAVKDYVENVKNEENMSAVQKPKAVSAPVAQPVKKVIPQSGFVTCVKGMFNGAQIPLANGEELIIGRGAEVCHIILEGSVISRKHCIIQYDGTTGNYVVTDCSENGTYLGSGGRIPHNKKLALSPGTLICIGNDENVFQLG